MDIKCYNKNDMKIIVETNKPSILSDLLSWNTIYLFNDIFILNFEKSEIKMQIYFKNKFHDCILLTENLNLKTDCNLLLEKYKLIQLNSQSLYSLLNNLGNYLDLVNDKHDNFNPISENKKLKIVENRTFNWNPYVYLNIKKSLSFDLNTLKNNSLNYYKDTPFNCQNLNITKEHILEVICQELKQIENNENLLIITYENLFEFDILFKNFNNQNLIDDLEDNELEGIKMNIKLNSNLYPFYPPSISFKNKLDNNLEYILNKLPYFNPKNWNPTNSLLNMLTQIHSILDKYAVIKSIISNDFQNLESLIQNIISLKNIKINSLKEWDNINIHYIKLNDKSNNSDSKFWNSGVGYGTIGRNDWNIKKYVEEIKVKSDQELKLIKSIHYEISKCKNITKFQEYITNSNLIDIIIDYISSFNIIDIDKNYKFLTFNYILSILEELNLNNWDNLLEYELGIIYNHLLKFSSVIQSFIKINSNITEEKKNFFNKINNYIELFEKFKINSSNEINTDHYCSIMKDFQLSEFLFTKYYFHKENNNINSKSIKGPIDICTKKIQKELATYINSLPMNYNSSIYVRYNPNNIRNIKALIIGPKDTPYENGCYIFDIFIPNEYPNIPPKVNLQTTGGGSVRFNPNLYNSGKVCLSLLGTWSGNGGEKWNKDTSTLLQVLVSIQSLILVENPYFNEPGYEKGMHSEKGKKLNFEYNDKRRLWNIMWAINDYFENSCIEFNDVIINHFRLKRKDIINKINEWYSETSDKNTFNIHKNKCINLLNEL
jgi:ubiquitin-protein ligase